MNRKIMLLVCAALLTALFSGCVGSERGETSDFLSKGALQGIVFDKWDPSKFIQGATISFDRGNYAGSSDQNGRYFIDDIEPGMYLVTAEAAGYVTETAKITIKKATESHINFNMTPTELQGKKLLQVYLSGASAADPVQGVTEWGALLSTIPAKADDDITSTGIINPVGSIIGGWEYAAAFESPAKISGKAVFKIWANTTLPALSTYFEARITLNGEEIGTAGIPSDYAVQTETKDMMGGALQFNGTADIPEIAVNAGDKIGIVVYAYSAASFGPIGIQVLCGSILHPSSIALTVE
ncbi:MAG: carboxypeptidase regulatory-like domain-containing protein [Candidatus Thermoplasmatota archaeon]|nr:carboxypeptidase regulatory-like domain-containing protein [Candidatus Thermoplasmatota archaeon]